MATVTTRVSREMALKIFDYAYSATYTTYDLVTGSAENVRINIDTARHWFLTRTPHTGMHEIDDSTFAFVVETTKPRSKRPTFVRVEILQSGMPE